VRAKIPVYWIADLTTNQVEVYADPTGPCDKPDYRQHHVYGPNDRLPVVLDGVEVGQIEIKDVLP
jgi:Uma2 family endonuclease